MVQVKEIQPGDKIEIYVDRSEGGSSMGPGVYGEPKFLTTCAWAGTLTEVVGQAIHLDGSPVGIPISYHDIVSHDPGNTETREAYRKQMKAMARKHGGHHTEAYRAIEWLTFDDVSPFDMGDLVTLRSDFAEINKKHKVQNRYRVLVPGYTFTFISFEHASMKCRIRNNHTGKEANCSMAAIIAIYL